MLALPQPAAAAPPPPTDSTEDHQAKRTRYSDEPDLKVVVGTGEQQQTFHVHATVLILCSKYFRAKLTSEHFGKDVVELPDELPDEFGLFYHSLSVVSSVPLSAVQAAAVGAFANKYDVVELKKQMDAQLALAPLEGHPSGGPFSLRFALAHNLHQRAARCVETMPLEAKYMPQLRVLTEQDHSEDGRQALLLKKLWPTLRKAAALDELAMPAPARLGYMWPFLTARIAAVPCAEGCTLSGHEHSKKARWLTELEPAKWLGDEADTERKAAYAVLIKCLWPSLCKEAAVGVPMPSLRHIQSTWPFVSRAVLSAAYPGKYEKLVKDARTVLAAVKQWPDQLHAELPAYPKRSSGSPDEEAKRSLESKIARCGLEELGQGGATAPWRRAPGPDSDSD